MRHGHTLPELALTIAVIGVVVATALPRIRGWLDWIAVQQSALEVTSALAVTRNAAIARAARTRLTISPDSLRLDEWDDTAWVAHARFPGPDGHGVTLAVSNPIVAFDPIGLGWGVANTRVVLSRGLQDATITTSRLGRVKRW
jgi:Tfp pilus assembly protein FimT